MNLPILTLESARQQLRALGFYGLLAHAETLLHEPWLARVIDIEASERQQRSLKRRLDNARLGTFKSLADFDWTWPTKCDRNLLDELFSLAFVADAANVVLLGPNGLGKTLLLKNLTHQVILHGYTARFTLAADMLHDLAAQDSSTALTRRLRRYTTPAVLAIDEVGYLAYDARYADLLFEVVSRRYQLQRPILLTTNKAFAEWNQIFPNAACVVTLIDRLVHRAEIVALKGKSYRLKEAEERAARNAKSRHAKPRKERMTIMLQPNDLPLICLPTELSGEAAAHLVEFLHELTEAIERHYFAQLHNHYHPEICQRTLDLQAPPSDPPF